MRCILIVFVASIASVYGSGGEVLFGLEQYREAFISRCVTRQSLRVAAAVLSLSQDHAGACQGILSLHTYLSFCSRCSISFRHHGKTQLIRSGMGPGKKAKTTEPQVLLHRNPFISWGQKIQSGKLAIFQAKHAAPAVCQLLYAPCLMIGHVLMNHSQRDVAYLLWIFQSNVEHLVDLSQPL